MTDGHSRISLSYSFIYIFKVKSVDISEESNYNYLYNYIVQETARLTSLKILFHSFRLFDFCFMAFNILDVVWVTDRAQNDLLGSLPVLSGAHSFASK